MRLIPREEKVFDLYTLVHKMDSILDLIEASPTRMHLCRITIPTDAILSMAKVLKRCISGLRSMEGTRLKTVNSSARQDKG
jgi:uncharacterized protein Yka (UPF0111/DUF47 family)